MSNPNSRLDLPSFTPGFQAANRARCQWHVRKDERSGLYWRATGTPTALNWARALRAIAASTAPTGG
jgi:hypothetical protein